MMYALLVFLLLVIPIFNVFTSSLLSETNNEVEKISSSNLKINVDLEEESLILLTIPYEEGFEVKTNGELVQSEVVYNSLMAIKVPKGSSTIQIDYCPKGLTFGALISGFALVTTIIYLYIEKRKLKQYEKISE